MMPNRLITAESSSDNNGYVMPLRPAKSASRSTVSLLMAYGR